ncbi:hypothetical protein G6O69_17135 [Pseudenhygromyxa sp. WMMC2535]|uniref:hypothetical protein n=1 Tax=Pseudenhygromyxa sp. WMMC2535 TaxID=2712867 RepID=UPI001556569B|nr:hypothetical protein [Pseudenhygromyxa sp. WMMC2535]NVB39570.1 hypothetical protein [Pseudenhygromyxa sp. WMMC2535]
MLQAKCELSVELEHPRRHYRPGERITGWVRVEVDAATKCDGLALTQLWRAEGAGESRSGGRSEFQLFSGEWAPGVHRYPFDLACPEEPGSYHGGLFSVEWQLEARADVPWALDVEASADFFVELNTDVEVEITQRSVPESSMTFDVIMTTLLVLMVAVGVFSTVNSIIEGDIGMSVFGIVACAGFVYMLWIYTKRAIARRALSRLTMNIERPDAGRVALDIDCASSRKIEGALVKLVAEEYVNRVVDGKRSYSNETIYEDTQHVTLGQLGQHSFRVEFELPDFGEVPWTFSASCNEIKWYVLVDVDIENWPDLEERIPLEIRPVTRRNAGLRGIPESELATEV